MAFADTTVGHSGTIYKAAGFEASKGSKTYWYIDGGGYWWHKRTIAHQASRNHKAICVKEKSYDHKQCIGKESLYANHHNLIKIKGKEVLRFTKWL